MSSSATGQVGYAARSDRWSLAFDRPVARDAGRVVIAVASADGARVDGMFEDTEAFLLYERDGCRTCFIGRQACPVWGEESEPLRRTGLLADCDLVLCCGISDTCRQKLTELGIECNLAYAGATVSEAVSAFIQGPGG